MCQNPAARHIAPRRAQPSVRGFGVYARNQVEQIGGVKRAQGTQMGNHKGKPKNESIQSGNRAGGEQRKPQDKCGGLQLGNGQAGDRRVGKSS